MSGWGTGWNKGQLGKLNTEPREYSKEMIEKWGTEAEPHSINWVLEQNDKNSVWDGPIERPTNIGIREIKECDAAQDVIVTSDMVADVPKFLNNKHPTHDPYTNPNAHIYYQCGCGAILDPGTKSFAALNNCASNAGWKVRWGADTYVPYCVKCGEDVE